MKMRTCLVFFTPVVMYRFSYVAFRYTRKNQADAHLPTRRRQKGDVASIHHTALLSRTCTCGVVESRLDQLDHGAAVEEKLTSNMVRIDKALRRELV